MTDAAAFKAEYSDFKLIRTRKTVQVIFEVPVEQSNDVLRALGGMPNPGTSVWCAIARLNEKEVMPNSGTDHSGRSTSAEHETPPRPAPAQSGGAKHITNDKPSTSWHQLPAAQQAGIRCGEAAFRRFLAETSDCVGIAMFDLDMAADEVRDRCKVDSRADLDKNPSARKRWDSLESQYRAWLRAPEVAGV